MNPMGRTKSEPRTLSEKLRLLAKWFDLPATKAKHPDWGETDEVQYDIRKAADTIESLQADRNELRRLVHDLPTQEAWESLQAEVESLRAELVKCGERYNVLREELAEKDLDWMGEQGGIG